MSELSVRYSRDELVGLLAPGGQARIFLKNALGDYADEFSENLVHHLRPTGLDLIESRAKYGATIFRTKAGWQLSFAMQQRGSYWCHTVSGDLEQKVKEILNDKV